MTNYAGELAQIFKAPDGTLNAEQTRALAEERLGRFLGWLSLLPTSAVAIDGYIAPNAQSFFAVYRVGEEGTDAGVWTLSMQGNIEQPEDGFGVARVSALRGITVRQGSSLYDGHVLEIKARNTSLGADNPPLLHNAPLASHVMRNDTTTDYSERLAPLAQPFVELSMAAAPSVLVTDNQ